MKQSLTATVAALTLLLTTGMAARATPMSSGGLAYVYNFAPGAPAVFADGTHSAFVNFTNDSPNPSTKSSTDVVATSLNITAPPGASTAYTLTTSGAYTLSVQVTTNDSLGHAVTGTLTFHGKLSGSFDADSSNVSSNVISDPVQSLVLGGYTFTFNMNAFTPPPKPGSPNLGSIGGHLNVTSLTPQGNAPEPGTMVLSGLGLSLLGGAAWRKRRQARLAVAV